MVHNRSAGFGHGFLKVSPTRPKTPRPAGGGLSLVLLAILPLVARPVVAATNVLVGWTDVGLHEFDSTDCSVYSLMPPYSTIQAQLVSGGLLLTNPAGITVTYQAVADASGSINSTSQGKGNFYQNAAALYGKVLAPDAGLAGFSMPGRSNQPMQMVFDPVRKSFAATGIPLTPYDDQGKRNPFPLMRLVARDSRGTLLATTDLAVSVSDGMDCRRCHASGAEAEARPPHGWAWATDPLRDYKLNVLQSHDDHLLGSSEMTRTLGVAGYNPAGLVATVLKDGKPISCLRCHPGGGIPDSGLAGARPLTQVMHTKHAYISDPATGITLIATTNSGACLACHIGSEKTALRGVHHRTVNADGSAAMQCQSCHGTVGAIGAATRVGWVNEPACQSCHTGTATSNSGALRYTSVFTAPGQTRVAANATFGTPTNAQSGGFVRFQQATGHGGLGCAACHGSSHAEWPSSQANENLQSRAIQGQVGVLTSCTACHPTRPSSSTGGPHGLHPVDSRWASNHDNGTSGCKVCHGADSRGTVLSEAQIDQTFSGDFGTHHFWPGFQIGCYTCHGGPNGGNNGNTAPVVSSFTKSVTAEVPLTFSLAGTDANGNALSYWVVSPPANGRVSVNGTVATYYPFPGFVGTDSFQYAAWDGSTESATGTVTLAVNPGACSVTASALAPMAAFPNAPVPFRGAATLSACTGALTYDWDFGDGSPHGSGTNVAHVYALARDYDWSLVVTGGGATERLTGTVTVSPTLGPPVAVALDYQGFLLEVSWPVDRVPTSLETSVDLADPFGWQSVIDPVFSDGVSNVVDLLVTSDQQFFRLRRVP
jgi:PKD repeat protein